RKVQVRALVDSGATTTFINKSVVESNNLVKEKLAHPFEVINADDSPNKNGTITHSVKGYLEIGSHRAKTHLLVTRPNEMRTRYY
ncbi:hypothetical protein K435DRAFT_692987, partial [Dendrothele bispora CBS 962.96]